MAAPNLFEELKEALKDFKDFLDQNVPVIKPAIKTLASIIPQVNDLINLLAGLIGDLKKEIQNLDVKDIPGLSKVSEFTGKVTGTLEKAKNLLPNQAGAIDEVLGVANVVTGLPSLEEIKAEITSLLDAILNHLNSLKSA